MFGKRFEYFCERSDWIMDVSCTSIGFLGLKGVFIKILLGVKLVAILFQFGISANRAIVRIDCLSLEFYVFAKF